MAAFLLNEGFLPKLTDSLCKAVETNSPSALKALNIISTIGDLTIAWDDYRTCLVAATKQNEIKVCFFNFNFSHCTSLLLR